MLSEINMSLSPRHIFFPAFCRAQTFFSSTHVSPMGISISFILSVLLLLLFPVGSFFMCFVERAASQISSPWPGFLLAGFRPPWSPLPLTCCHLISSPDVQAHPRPNPSAEGKYPQYGRSLNQAGHTDHNIGWEDNHVCFFHSLGCSISRVVFRIHTGRTGACTGERGKCS